MTTEKQLFSLLAFIVVSFLGCPSRAAPAQLNLFDASHFSDNLAVAIYLTEKYQNTSAFEVSQAGPDGLPPNYAYCYTGSVNVSDVLSLCSGFTGQDSPVLYSNYTLTASSDILWADFFIPTNNTLRTVTAVNSTLAQCSALQQQQQTPFTLSNFTTVSMALGQLPQTPQPLDDQYLFVCDSFPTCDVFTQRIYTNSLLWHFLPVVDDGGFPTDQQIATEPSDPSSWRVGASVQGVCHGTPTQQLVCNNIHNHLTCAATAGFTPGTNGDFNNCFGPVCDMNTNQNACTAAGCTWTLPPTPSPSPSPSLSPPPTPTNPSSLCTGTPTLLATCNSIHDRATCAAKSGCTPGMFGNNTNLCSGPNCGVFATNQQTCSNAGCTWTGLPGATVLNNPPNPAPLLLPPSPPSPAPAKICPNTGYGLISFQFNGQLWYVAPELSNGLLFGKTPYKNAALQVRPMGSALLTVNTAYLGYQSTYLGAISLTANTKTATIGTPDDNNMCLGYTPFLPPGTPPMLSQNSYKMITHSDSISEASIWTIDINGTMSMHWLNAGGSPPGTPGNIFYSDSTIDGIPCYAVSGKATFQFARNSASPIKFIFMCP